MLVRGSTVTITSDQYINMKCAQDLQRKVARDPYLNTAFESARNLSSRSKGAFFEKLTKEWIETTFGVKPEKPESSQHDVRINGVKIEIKGSTVWVNEAGQGTHFRWQQIRIDQDYDVMIFLAMYPTEVKFYWATKQDLQANLDRLLNNQHGGKEVDSGTMFIDGFPENFTWMKQIVDSSFCQ